VEKVFGEKFVKILTVMLYSFLPLVLFC